MHPDPQSWQPIATAPKDGSDILVFLHTPKGKGYLSGPSKDTDEYRVARWYSTDDKKLVDAPELGPDILRWEVIGKTEGWQLVWGAFHSPAFIKPTHWRPLPAPPAL